VRFESFRAEIEAAVLTPVTSVSEKKSAARRKPIDASSCEPQSSAIPSAGEREPPKEPSSSPHRARIRCSTELAGWPDRTDDWHRAGESQNGPAELAYNIRRLVTLERTGAPINCILTTDYEPKSRSGRTSDQFDEKIVIFRGALASHRGSGTS
jgi:hypothetical protein